MIPSKVQGYFAEKLASLGLREHPNGFARDNVPATIADQTYFLEMAQVQILPANQIASKFVMPITLNIYFKDYRTQTDLRSAALRKMELIMALILEPKRSLGDGGFSIQATAVAIDAVSPQNQASGILKVSFDVTMYLNFRGI